MDVGESTRRSPFLGGGQLDDPPGPHLGGFPHGVPGQGGTDQTRTHGVDRGPDVLQDPGVLDGQHVDPGLAGVVGLVVERVPGVGLDAGLLDGPHDGRDEDDTRVVSGRRRFSQQWHARVGQTGRADDVDRHGPGEDFSRREALGRLVDPGHVVDQDTRVVDEDVETTKILFDLVDRGGDGCVGSDVQLDGLGRVSLGGDGFGHFFSRLQIPRTDEDVETMVSSQDPGGRFTNLFFEEGKSGSVRSINQSHEQTVLETTYTSVCSRNQGDCFLGRRHAGVCIS